MKADWCPLKTRHGPATKKESAHRPFERGIPTQPTRVTIRVSDHSRILHFTAMPLTQLINQQRRYELVLGNEVSEPRIACDNAVESLRASKDTSDVCSNTRRRVLFGVAAQLALLCALTSVFEGLVTLAPLGRLIVDAAGDELLSATRAVPALVALHLLLDRTKSTYLLALQLLVVAKLHERVLVPSFHLFKTINDIVTGSGFFDVTGKAATEVDTYTVVSNSSASHSSGVATVALAVLMLVYPHLRVEHRVAANPWVVALLLFSLGGSAVLASADMALGGVGSHVLLFNCGFFACTAFALAVLMGPSESSSFKSSTESWSVQTPESDYDDASVSPPATRSTLSPTLGVRAFGVSAMLASCIRLSMNMSERTFLASLVVQLALTLFACSEELSGGRRQDFNEEASDEMFADDAYVNGTVVRFINVLVKVATAATALVCVSLVLRLLL